MDYIIFQYDFLLKILLFDNTLVIKYGQFFNRDYLQFK